MPISESASDCSLCLQVTLAATLTNARGSPLYWEITPQNMVRAGGSPPWTPVAHVPLPAARHANSHPSSLSFLPTPHIRFVFLEIPFKCLFLIPPFSSLAS